MSTIVDTPVTAPPNAQAPLSGDDADLASLGYEQKCTAP